MIKFTALWLLSTVGLQLAIPRMGAWVEITAVALYGAVTFYGWIYWNAKIAERAA